MTDIEVRQLRLELQIAEEHAKQDAARVRALEALVESAYREGYDVGAGRSYAVDDEWSESDAKSALDRLREGRTDA